MEDFYVKQTKKLLKFYDKALKAGKAVRANLYGDKFAEIIRGEAKDEFTKMIPQIPYVGGKEPFTKQIILNAVWIAVYKVMKRHGKSVDEIWKLCQDMNEAYIDSIPKIFIKMIKMGLFSKKMKKMYRSQAEESQKKIYPEADVIEFIEGDGIDYDYGIDIIKCSKCNFYRDQDAEELLPYCCLIDKLWAEKYGYGFVRTQTLAEGGTKCDFRLKKEGEVKVASSV